MRLSEEETKLVQKCNLLPRIAMASLIMDFAVCGLWLVLVMIDDIAFENSSFYSEGMYLFLGIVVLYLIVFICAMFVPRFGRTGKRWAELVQKLEVWQRQDDYAGQVAGIVGLEAAGGMLNRYGRGAAKKIGRGMEIAGAVGTVGVVAGINWNTLMNARFVAAACGVEIPKARKYVLPLVLVPMLVLIGAYIPEYADSASVVRQEKQIASEAVERLRETFEKECYYVSVDDPFERYQDYGYSVYGYLYDFDERTSYLAVRVGNDGLITEVTYHMEVDLQKGKEENLELAESEMERLYGLLSEADLAVTSEDLCRKYALPEEFREALIEGSYYEEINRSEDGQDGARIYLSYMTEPEEEYDEYSSSYISLYIRAD